MDWQLTGDRAGIQILMEGRCEMNGSAPTQYRMPGKLCPFRPCRHKLDFLQCRQLWMDHLGMSWRQRQ